MPYLTKACEGDDCMLGSCVQHDADIRNTTTTFADAHELPPPYASSSSEHTTIVARTVRLWVSIQSEPDRPNYNLAAIHDICLLYSDEKTKQDLAECGNIFIIITDVSDIDIHLKDCFHDVHATVCIIRPTRRHVEFGVRYAAGVLRPGDECTMWFGCFGGLEVNKLQLVDSSALVTGTELLRWMTEHTNPQALIQVILDICNSGNFPHLPWYFDRLENLIPSGKPALSNNTAKILRISHFPVKYVLTYLPVIYTRCTDYGGLLWHLVHGIRGAQGSFRLDRIQAKLTDRLSNPGVKGWTQRPLVSMSYKALRL